MRMKDIEGFEDRYAITDDGRVWSKRYQRWLALQENHSGYLKVGLHRKDKHEKHFVHRLVCEAFHGKPPTPAHQVDHINRNRADNRASNLRWVTPSANVERSLAAFYRKACHPIIGVNDKGEVIRFESIREAQRNGFPSIRYALKKQEARCKGYVFTRVKR